MAKKYSTGKIKKAGIPMVFEKTVKNYAYATRFRAIGCTVLAGMALMVPYFGNAAESKSWSMNANAQTAAGPTSANSGASTSGQAAQGAGTSGAGTSGAAASGAAAGGAVAGGIAVSTAIAVGLVGVTALALQDDKKSRSLATPKPVTPTTPSTTTTTATTTTAASTSTSSAASTGSSN
jgi:hypothetical protein|tara:strand:+ start:1299 stop:1835 length:537 start_codon:yes stop_codon:yes gene_type:complete